MKVISTFRRGGIMQVTIATIVSLFLVVSVVQAATTISTDITTEGALSVTGASTLTGNVTASGTLGVTGASTFTGLVSATRASSTRLSVFDKAYFGGSATTTVDSSGNVSVAGTLAVPTGLSTFGSGGIISQASSTVVGNFTTTGTNALGGALNVTGLSTLTSFVSTASSTVVGNFTTTGTNALGGALNVTGLTTFGPSNGFVSQASSTVVGDLTVTGTFSPAITSASSFTVSGLTSLSRATSTLLSVHDTAYFGGSATSSFSSAGVLSLAGINNSLLATGSSGAVSATTTPTALYFIATSTDVASAFPYASSTALTATIGYFTTSTSTTANANTGNIGTLTVNGVGTFGGTAVLAGANFSGLASTTQLKVGSDNVSTVSGIITGVCSIAEISGLVASSTVQLTCSGATGVTTAYKVFVQATSSIPAQIVIQSATSSTDAIEVRFLNTGINGGTPASAAASLNFWAVR